jgi:hypothetical protein
LLPLLVPLALGLGGCFDSDDTNATLGDDGGTTRGPKPNELPPEETGDGALPPDVGVGEATCDDAVNCVTDCALELANNIENPEEIDLSCFFDCEAGLTVDEALKLVRAGACVFQYCTDSGFCEATPEDPLAILGFGTCDFSTNTCEDLTSATCNSNTDCPGTCLICLLNGVNGGDAVVNDLCETELMECEGT